jgi:WS/DGAT/MGAT family acyltransferase
MDQLKPQDAQFLYLESTDNHIHVTSIFIFDPSTRPGKKKLKFEDVLEHIKQRLPLSPICKRKLVHVPFELDFPYWVEDEHFDIDYHVRHERLPEPADWQELCTHLALYHSRPLDMSRPLWEMIVIEGLNNIDGVKKGSFALVTKVHHAAVDGMSLIRFFASLLDADKKGTPAVPLAEIESEGGEMPGIIDIAGRALWNALRSPIGLTDAIMRSAPNLYRFANDLLATRREPSNTVPDTRFNCLVSPHKVFDATVFDLEDLKAMRQEVPGSTVNDVVLCICAGALRRYLDEHQELPEDPLVAWVPINARSGKNDDEDGVGNNITSMTTPIYTNIADPVERLAAIHVATQRSKAARRGISARLMTDLSQHVPAATLVTASRLVVHAGMAARVCNLFISNVPGPQVPMYLQGAEQVGAFGMAPLADGMGLFIATPSFNGKITFNVTSTREAMPDIRFFVSCLKEAVDELRPSSGSERRSA